MRHFIYAVLFIGFPAAAIVGLFFDSVSPEQPTYSSYEKPPVTKMDDTSRTTLPDWRSKPLNGVMR